MKDRKKIGIYFIVLWLTVLNTYGSNEFFFSQLGVRNGLSQSSVNSIFQDSDGYLWFGTKNGANRYDGYNFKVYQNEVDNINTISDSYINAIGEDGYKNIWIGTANGLNCIDHYSGEITRIYPKDILPSIQNNSITHFLLQKNGDFYVFSNQEIFKCTEQKKLEHVKLSSEINSDIRSVASDCSGNIYVGTSFSGLYIYDESWNFKLHLINDTYNSYSFLESSINAIITSVKPYLIIGTENNGLCIYNKDTQKFFNLDKGNSGLSSNNISSFTWINEEYLLIGSFGGLDILNISDMSISTLETNMKDGELSHYSIQSLFLDKDRTCWVGTYSAGVNYYSSYLRSTTLLTFDEFGGVFGKGVEDKNGTMWFATEGIGLMNYDIATGRKELYPLFSPFNKNYRKNIITSLAIKGDTIYCSSHDGFVYIFSLQTKKYYPIDNCGTQIHMIYMDSKKRLWIADQESLCRIEYRKDKNKSFRKSFFQFSKVSTMEEIQEDVFLIGTLNDSIYLYDISKQAIYNLADDIIYKDEHQELGITSSIVTDDDYIWISTTKSGLYKFDQNLELIKHYNHLDGLPESYISSLILDKTNTLWVLTGTSVYKLDRQEDRFYHRRLSSSRPQEFTLHAGSTASDGTIFFPGNRGINHYNPQTRKVNPNPPPVYITSVLTDHQQKKNDGRLKKKILFDKHYKYEIKLSSKENNIAIQYVALNYIHPRENQYAFMMDGIDKNWLYVGNRQEAYYSNLRPGKYLFRLKGSNNDGEWNLNETHLYITISRPFYLSCWAYCLYFCLIFFIVYKRRTYRIQQRKLKHEIRYKQLEHKKAAELHEEKMKLFSNFSHELKVPLTLIINPLNKLLNEFSFSPDVKKTLEMIKIHSHRMLVLVNNLMDLQKYESGVTVLKKKNFCFSMFIREIEESFMELAHERKITFKIINNLPENYIVNYDKTEIEKIFFNLLSNSFKFTPSAGYVCIDIQSLTSDICKDLPDIPPNDIKFLCEKRYLFIEIKDTGVGFNEEQGKRLFEPFTQFEEDIQGEIPGTGIGLSLTRSIILQHNGLIWAKGEKGKGAHFYILLPDMEEQKISIQQGDNKLIEKTNDIIQQAESITKHTLLIADDNKELVNYLELQFADEYQIIKANDGMEALKLVRENTIDFIISDVLMPDINGIELCKYIKEDPSLHHIPVILVSAQSMNSQIEKGLEVGADDYITKPFDINILKARVKNILSHREKMKNVYGEIYNMLNLNPEESDINKKFLVQYIELVKTNISDPNLDISTICKTLGISRANFYRKVKTITGVSPMELIKTIRLEVAAKLLNETEMNISEISEHIGFKDRIIFSKSFKTVYGKSPAIYRRDIRNKK